MPLLLSIRGICTISNVRHHHISRDISLIQVYYNECNDGLGGGMDRRHFYSTIHIKLAGETTPDQSSKIQRISAHSHTRIIPRAIPSACTVLYSIYNFFSIWNLTTKFKSTQAIHQRSFDIVSLTRVTYPVASDSEWRVAKHQSFLR